MHAGEFFLRHVTLLAIVIGHRAAPNKRIASRRSLQCSPCNDKQYSLSFFKARRSAAWGGVWWGRTLSCRKIKSDFGDVKGCFNPLTAKLFNLNFHPLEVVDRVNFK